MDLRNWAACSCRRVNESFRSSFSAIRIRHAASLYNIHGAADKLTFSSGSEDFARLASENNHEVTLKLWDGFYHEIHNEPEKAEVFKVMIEWLDKHLS